MGEVYLAEHPGLPRRDALKILPADVSADPDFRARFNREAAGCCIATSNPPTSCSQIQKTVNGGSCWPTSGSPRQLGDISGLTATNFTVGTVAYSAPEQLMGADIDGRADQYALAASAYHLLTGAQPYRHSNAVAVISQHLNAAPPKLSDRRSELAHLDQVLSTALAKDPADRFGRCREFATKLSERAAVDAGGDRPTEAAVTVAAPTAGSAQPGRRSAPPPSWMRPAIIIATLVALMVIGSLIFVGIELSRPRSPSPPLATAPSTPNPVTPTLTPVISPPPSPVPPLATTTEPLTTTTAAASGPTLGEPCSDFDKLAYDRNAGENLRTHCVPAMTRLRRS
jgi:serine/threonine protein kinase, bacterial